MTEQERAARLLSRLPTLLQAGPNLQRICEAIGSELVVMERATRQLMESRWYKLARGFGTEVSLAEKANSELGSIGALFDLHPGAGESEDYFRKHLAALVRIHARGLGTARAILELVSLVYLAEQPPLIEVREGLAIGRFQVQKEDGTLRQVRVELVDNPPSVGAARFLGVRANQQVVTYNAGLDQAFPDIELKASGGDVTIPLLHQEESGLDVIYLGTINSGQTLRLRHGQSALIDGEPVDSPVLIANPTRFARSATDDHVFRFDTPEARYSLCEASNQLSPLLPGETCWHYRIMGRAELHDYLFMRSDLSAFVERALVEPTAPPVDLTFRWAEVTPAAFELRIPIDYVPPQYRVRSGRSSQRDWIGFFRDVQAALEYGRAAGVRAIVGLAMPLPAEVVDIRDGTPGMTASLTFAEQQLATDQPAASETSIALQDSLTPPGDAFGIGGIYNNSCFSDLTRFQ